MEKIKFSSYAEMACDIANKFKEIKKDDVNIDIVANYDDARNLLTELCKLDFNIVSIKLEHPEFSEYWDEYYISVGSDGIWIEHAKRDDRYFYADANIVYFMDDCSSEILKYCEANKIYEVFIGDDTSKNTSSDSNLDTLNSESTHISKDINGKPIGFQKSWSSCEDGITTYTSYSHYCNDKDVLKKIAKDFGIEL